jgi:hypothetical protein
MLRWLILGALCFVLGCAEVQRRNLASMPDYEAYRRYRLASALMTKLSASYDYLYRHPTGRWRSEVQSWFRPAQDAYLEAAWDDLDRLRRFLSAVPDGPPARRAASRVVELELQVAYRERKEREFSARVSRIDARLAAARQGRQKLVRQMVEWTKLLASIRRWGVRTHELPHELIYAFRLTPPEGRCGDSRCIKPLMLAYAIPEAKAQSDRVALLDVVIDLDRGGVQRIVLTGPDLFTRLGEALLLRPILPTDVRGRTEALIRARQLVEVSVEPAMPGSRCAVEPISPILFHRRCDGTELRLIVASEAEEEDRLEVRALTAADEAHPGGSTPREEGGPELRRPDR